MNWSILANTRCDQIRQKFTWATECFIMLHTANKSFLPFQIIQWYIRREMITWGLIYVYECSDETQARFRYEVIHHSLVEARLVLGHFLYHSVTMCNLHSMASHFFTHLATTQPKPSTHRRVKLEKKKTQLDPKRFTISSRYEVKLKAWHIYVLKKTSEKVVVRVQRERNARCV